MSEVDRDRTQRVLGILKAVIEANLGSDDESAAPEPAELLDELLSRPDGVRDLALILLAYSVDAGHSLNLVEPDGGDLGSNGRLRGDRTVSDRLREYLRSVGIEATASAVESSTFRSGYLPAQTDRPVIRDFVHWLSDTDRTIGDLKAAFGYLARRIAATARLVPPLPRLSARRCTFPRVMAVFDALLHTPSEGRYEQYLLGSLLESVHEEQRNGLTVTTKAVSTTDRAARTAGDIEIRQGQNLVDAIEVSARPWDQKIVQAVAALEARPELDRMHIVGAGSPTGGQILDALEASELPSGVQPEDVDLTVRDVRSVIATITADLSRAGRRDAIERLHDKLRGYAAPVDLIEHLCDLVTEYHLTVN